MEKWIEFNEAAELVSKDKRTLNRHLSVLKRTQNGRLSKEIADESGRLISFKEGSKRYILRVWLESTFGVTIQQTDTKRTQTDIETDTKRTQTDTKQTQTDIETDTKQTQTDIVNSPKTIETDPEKEALKAHIESLKKQVDTQAETIGQLLETVRRADILLLNQARQISSASPEPNPEPEPKRGWFSRFFKKSKGD